MGRRSVDGSALGASPAWQAEVASISVRFGSRVLEELGEAARELGGSRVWLATDPGLVAAGHPQRARRSLEAAGIAVRLYAEAEENPTESRVESAAAEAREWGPDLIVGLGGGSALDVAKAVNLLLPGGRRIAEWQGLHRPEGPLLPSIGVPTTAGTGSEAQSYALVSTDEGHRKMACGAREARFRTVLLDPSLPASAPPRVAALAGLDALSHALESLVSTRSNPISRVWSLAAWCRIERALPEVLAGEAAAEVWGGLLLGAHLAGAAIEQSMLGAAHATANPLTARYGVPHGAAVSLMLPHVVRFNAEADPGLYADLGSGVALDADPSRRTRSADSLAGWVRGLASTAGIPECLAAAGVPETDLPELADEAAEQWTGRFNPRALDRAGALELYRVAWPPPGERPAPL